MAKVVVSLDAPHQILMSDSSFTNLLQYNAEEIMGRSVKFLFGPKTDSIKIHSAIKSASFSKETTIHVVLYSRFGEPRNIVFTCSPFKGYSGDLQGCLIVFENSGTISLQEALQDSPSAKALISAQQPYMVQMTNESFASIFGFSQSQVLGRSLRSIHGPRTDSNLFCSMIRDACSGRISRGNLCVCTSACIEFIASIIVIPVVEAQSDCISNLLVLLDYAAGIFDGQDAGSEPSGRGVFTTSSTFGLSASSSQIPDDVQNMSDNCRASYPAATWPANDQSIDGQLSADFVPSHRAEVEFFPAFPAGCSADLSSGCWVGSSAPAPPRCSTILRRRKAGDTDADADGGVRPVSITLELLESMADLTIVAAAQRIRVSTTSLKKACRKLGVERWPYRKDRPAAAATAAKPTTIPRDFDEAYVRRLHRKYGGSGARRAGRPAGAGISRLESAASHSSVSSDGPEPEDGGDAAGAAAGWADRSRPEVECGLAWGGLGGCAEGDLDMAL